MKKIILLLALAVVANSALAKEIQDPEALYFQLTQLFPEDEEIVSGHSSLSIGFNSMSCFISTSRSSDSKTPTVNTECYAKSQYTGITYTLTDNVDGLIFTLINAGYAVDRTSEPGTTYVIADGVHCSSGTLVGSDELIYTCDDILEVTDNRIF